jgi:uncharacterized protein (UPF0548 family)
VFLLSRPSDAEIGRFLYRADESVFSYTEVGATSGLLPPLFTVDHSRVLLGCGPATWDKAIAAVREWKMFDLDWLALYSRSTPIRAGETVAVLARHLGCYSLNACRIAYVLEETAPSQRFGFAYGTLEDHAESGEERFTVEWNQETGEVWYDILAFSRPRHFLARVGYPFSRALQKKFAADSKRAMVQAVVGR